MAKMTEKQKRFCDEYLIDLNGAQAALRAGYSAKSAKSQANENLKKPYIRDYIDARLAEKEEALVAKQDEVLKYLTAVMRGDTKSAVVVVEGEGEGVSAARIVQKPPDEKERLRAAELLGKRYGAFTDKTDVSFDKSLNITIDYGDKDGSEDTSK